MNLKPKSEPDIPGLIRARRRCKAMTLVEVMVEMVIISIFATSAVSLMLQSQKQNLANFYRLEAYRLAQTIAEHAMQGPYSNFDDTGVQAASATGTPTVWTWSNTENAMLRSIPSGNKDATFTYPAGANPVIFTKTIKTILNCPKIGSAKVLQVNIEWDFGGRHYSTDCVYAVLGQSGH